MGEMAELIRGVICMAFFSYSVLLRLISLRRKFVQFLLLVVFCQCRLYFVDLWVFFCSLWVVWVPVGSS